MDETVVEKEGQPVISNLFPVGEQSVLTAFRDLIPPKNPSADQLASAEAAVDEEKRILGETNPHVLTSLEGLLEPYVKDNATQSRLGNLICHRVLREEAISQGGVLPTFTEQFVKDYDTKQNKKVEEELEDKKSLRPYQIGLQIRRADIAKFRNFEPEFSKIVEREFGDRPDWLPEDDFKYTGITYEYFMFRKGCSDPKNFQQ